MQITIEADQTEKHYLRDLWHYRELFLVLAWRDLAVRYKQTLIGILWAIIRPLLTMLILTFVFHKVAKLPADGSAPYPIMVLAALLPWTFFATALADASNSLITNANLVSKVYFPRLIVPTAYIAVALVDFLISLALMFTLMLYYQFIPTWKIFTLPLFTLLAMLAAIGPGLWITALNVKYRDFRYVIPFLIQFGLYISPVGYSLTQIPSQWLFLYSLNPLVGIIEGFRWAIIGNIPFPSIPLFISCPITLLFLGIGYFKFRKMERSFADII
ncbi:MAG: ABC transporter permease [Methylacidiphilales bacterium]|nr:ABC transporter permease [Candidatus Methylacidiphilales bacterium]MDW8349540.1 ABC transporter permease [Verrucomicrobiae bacterium]